MLAERELGFGLVRSQDSSGHVSHEGKSRAMRSGRFALHPTWQRRRLHGFHSRDQRRWLRIDDEKCAVLRSYELLGHRMIEKLKQWREVPIHVQYPIRLPMKAELPPRPNLEQFLERAQATWHSQEAIRQLGEQRLSLVHGRDDTEFREASVGDLVIDEMLRHDADDFTVGGERSLRQCAHKSRAPTAIHNASATLREIAAHLQRLFYVHWIATITCRTENADGVEGQLSARSSKRMPDILCIAKGNRWIAQDVSSCDAKPHSGSRAWVIAAPQRRACAWGPTCHAPGREAS